MYGEAINEHVTRWKWKKKPNTMKNRADRWREREKKIKQQREEKWFCYIVNGAIHVKRLSDFMGASALFYG